MNYEERELSPEATAIVHALFASSDWPRPRPSVSQDELERFAIGWVTGDEEGRILEALVASSESRGRLVALHAKTRAGLGVKDWGFLSDAVRTSMKVYMNATVFTDPSALTNLVLRGSHEAIAALSALRTIGDSLGGPSSTRWATTRSSELLERPTFESEQELRVRASTDPDLFFSLMDRPIVRDGKFRLKVRLTEESRHRVASRRVGLAISVGYDWVILITPRTRTVNGDSLELVYDAEGVEDGEFHALSVLRVVIED